MIVTGLYTYNNFLYFLNDKNQYILYRSASQTRFLAGEVPEPIIDINAIQTAISSHNYEVRRAAEMFEEALIQNVSFPIYVDSEYDE